MNLFWQHVTTETDFIGDKGGGWMGEAVSRGLSEASGSLSKLQESRELMLFDVLTMKEGAVSMCVCSCAIL